MKKLFIYLITIMAFVACSDSGSDVGGGNSNNDQPKAPEITLDATAVNFTADGGSTVVTFTSSDAWTAEAINNRADGWCSVSPTSGSAGNGKITITATANDSTDDRTATVVIKSGTTQKTIAVSQKQKDALTVTSSKFEVPAEGGDIEIEVKANINFSVEIDESAKSWVTHRSTRAMKTSTLIMEVDENFDSEKRKANISISGGGLKETITIYQESNKPSIVLTQNEYSVPSAGETIAVEVKSNVDVTVEMPKDADWITENTTRGVSTNTYYFDIETNEEYDQRSAEIKFINKENKLSETVAITQVQKDAIVIAEDSYTVSGNGEEIEIEVGHNIEFDVTIDVDWLTQKQTRAFETSNLVFVAAENDTDAERSGSITFTSKDGAISLVISVVQGIATFELYYTSIDGNVIDPPGHWYFGTNWGGAQIISNIYENGKGVITFDRKVQAIGASLFEDCITLRSIDIPISVKYIDDEAFKGCTSLQSVKIPNGITSIGDGVFQGCINLTDITIPESMGYIPYCFLSGCISLTDFTIPDNVETIGEFAFSNCSNLVNITIPDSVTTIGNEAFRGCSSLTSITIPKDVTTIGWSAFSGCISLTNITISEGVTMIGSSMFYGCTSLKEITIPNSVTNINPGAFSGCDNLRAFYGKFASIDNKYLVVEDAIVAFAPYNVTSYTIPNDVTAIGDNAFYMSNNLTSVTIHSGINSIGCSAFQECSNLSEVIISDGVKSIGEWAFGDCSSLANITLPESITSIGQLAFCRCSNVMSINIPNQISLINYGTFEGCSSLKSITIPENVILIGGRAFHGCGSLTNITIPNNVASVEGYAFYKCNNLQSVTIGESVKLIDNRAFDGCKRLKNIYCKPTNPPAGGYSMFIYNIDYDMSGRKIYVPKESVNAYKAANYWSDYADDIEGYDFTE